MVEEATEYVCLIRSYPVLPPNLPKSIIIPMTLGVVGLAIGNHGYSHDYAISLVFTHKIE